MDGNSNDNPVSPPVGMGLTRDIRALKDSGAASVAEMKTFLKSLKSRNPQEVIGIVSSNLLVQSLGIACVATALFMFVFTVGPYLIYGPPTAKAPPPKSAAQSMATSPSEGAAGTGATPSGQTDAEQAAQVMGLEETKSADPKTNPLDNPDIDKLLDGL